jgi:hypothetical protein
MPSCNQLAISGALLLALLACGRHAPTQTAARPTSPRAVTRPELRAELQGWIPRHFTLEPARDRLKERLDASDDDLLSHIRAELDHLKWLDDTFPDATIDDPTRIGYLNR